MFKFLVFVGGYLLGLLYCWIVAKVYDYWG